jgi:anti-sigma regulatory factor (Ser/Thr protein kinase)
MSRVPDAAREARVMARVVLAAWDLHGAADEAALLLSELVSNAVRHALGRVVRVAIDRPADDRVYLAVTDRAPGLLPRMRTPTDDDVCGRGLHLIEAFAVRWGYDLLGSGTDCGAKRVWAELEVSGDGQQTPVGR